MARQVIFSKKAVRQIDTVAAYLEEHFSLDTAQSFLKKVVALQPKMADYPETGRPTAINSRIRYLHIDDHRILFYQHDDERVKVMAMFDTRQDPAKRPH